MYYLYLILDDGNKGFFNSIEDFSLVYDLDILTSTHFPSYEAAYKMAKILEDCFSYIVESYVVSKVM